MSFQSTNPEQLFSDESPQATVHHQSAEMLSEPFEILPPVIPGPDAEEQVLQPAEVPITLTPPKTRKGCTENEIDISNVEDDLNERLSFARLMHEPFRAYRTDETGLTWLPGGGEQFGWVDWDTDMYLQRADQTGIVTTFNMHWLSGPDSAPLPPRLYDFAVGYQVRRDFSPQLSYDLYTSIGVYSDFEGSARDGVRFPSHAVGMFHVNSHTDFVFGVDYLATDTIGILPVFGLSLRDIGRHNLRMDLVFPRPRIDYMLSDSKRVYLSGKTTGGNWDVEFPSGAGDVMSYRDYRLTLGFENADEDGDLSAIEFGYVFGRSLTLRSRTDEIDFADTFMIRLVTRR